MKLAWNPGKETPLLLAGQVGEKTEGEPCCYRGRERVRGMDRKGGEGGRGVAVNGAGGKKTELRGETTT